MNTTLNIQCVLSRITDFMVDDYPVQRYESEHRSYRSDTNPEEHEVKMLNMGKDGSMVSEPGYLKVAPGDTINFLAVDTGHNSVSTFTPEGSVSWKGSINSSIVLHRQLRDTET